MNIYRKLRNRLARWLPDADKGVGFDVGEMDSGELELQLDVEGRTGSVYLSRAIWDAIGKRAGWTP